MKTLLAALMVLGSTAAFAQIDATEVAPKAKQEAQKVGQKVGMATEDQGTFRTSEAFNIKGTLKDAGREEVTVARKNLPPATLDIRDQTAVYVDGKKAQASELEEGMQVKARFQLEGDEVVAVRLDAKTSGYGGAGSSGTSQPEQKQQHPQQQQEQQQQEQQPNR